MGTSTEITQVSGNRLTDVTVQIFRTTSRISVDQEGHGHPGEARPTTSAMLTVTDESGNKGRCVGPLEHLPRRSLETYIRPVVVGSDALARAGIWTRLAHAQRGSQSTFLNHTLSIVEQALWDLAGNALGLPVWKMLGGYRDRIPVYGSTMCGDDIPGGLSTPQEYAAFAEKLVADGHPAIKLHTWMPPISFAPDVAMDIKACEAVREAVGPDIPLMLDGYHWYSRIDALRLGRALDRLNFHWFEEPMDEYSVQSYRWLARELDTPVIGPETVDGGIRSRAEWITAEACDILRIGVHTAGGIMASMKTSALAEAFGMDCEFHGGGAATLAVLSAVPNARWYERGLLHPFYDYDTPPPHLTRTVDPIDAQGNLRLPDAPGLGAHLDVDYIESETIETW